MSYQRKFGAGALSLLIGASLVGAIAKIAMDAFDDSEEEKLRKNTSFEFPDEMPEAKFQAIAMKTGRGYRQIAEIHTEGPVVCGEVLAGSSFWNFEIDFNDYGKLTGRYWVTSEDSFSDLPDKIAERISAEIQGFETSSEPETEQERIVNYCPCCGRWISEEGANFCTSCGTKLR